ncbi:MAG: hypothetical protein LC650_02360 [Actinobacteria bacterium]|nr:hypothetical protein [Actinomycetota bacterium]
MLKLKVQPEGVGICGQCSMAMVLDVPVSDVVKLLPTINGTSAGQRNRVMAEYYSKPVIEVRKVDNRKYIDLSGVGVIAISTTKGPRRGHAMAFKDGAIYDPGGRVFEGYRAMLDYYKEAWGGARVRNVSYVEVAEEDGYLAAGE